MPDYHITVHMKAGPPRRGTRWFASHDLERVKQQVAQKVKETIGQHIVDHIDVVIAENNDNEPLEYVL